MRRTITTAIDYPNAAPHMGHVLEKVLADALVRWHRLNGDDVYFQIGTDEHGIKIQQTAEKEKMDPHALVDRNVHLFQDLYARLGISFDVFIRTTDRVKHWPTVQALWQKLEDAGVLERRTYTGLYCSGCERFVTEKDLVDGLCPDHQKAPQVVEEENYFFLLSRETEWLKHLLSTDYRIVPSFREKETMMLLESGLEDVSFSRPKSSLAWGIPVPGDENQTMYVWCDALTNYISAIGLLTDHAKPEWWNDAQVTHVIGKDIARFHALIWPAMLKSAGLRAPDRLLIHGFLTSDGQKMSKSLGNVVKPEEVLTHFNSNPDPLRWYLLSEVPVGSDGDFSWTRIDSLYNSFLRNALGNLLNRVIVMLKKEDISLLINEHNICSIVDEQWRAYHQAFSEYQLEKAASCCMSLVAFGNAQMDALKPWTKEGIEKQVILSSLAEVLRHISLMLLPLLPTTAHSIATQLGLPSALLMTDRSFVVSDDMRTWGGEKNWTSVAIPSILFAPLEK